MKPADSEKRNGTVLFSEAFVGLSQILADAYCHHLVHPFVRLSITFSAIACFALLE